VERDPDEADHRGNEPEEVAVPKVVADEMPGVDHDERRDAGDERTREADHVIDEPLLPPRERSRQAKEVRQARGEPEHRERDREAVRLEKTPNTPTERP
jgi:hypothetical protein